MLNPSFSELDEISESRYEIVMLVAKRARDIIDGAEPLIPVRKDEKPVTVAIEEVMEGKVVIDEE